MAKPYLEYNAMVKRRNDNGFFALEYDQEAIVEFMKEVDEKLIPFSSQKDRFRYLVDNNFYYNAFDEYSWQDISHVIEHIYGVKFSFQSFMAISKFYQSYALKTDDKTKYLETYQDRIVITSLFLAAGSTRKAIRFANELIEQTYQMATPTFLSSGRARRGELVSCFLLGVQDSLNSLMFTANTASQLSKIGGGVSINLSNMRARGEEIKGIANAASGVMPYVKVQEDIFSYINQLGQRDGAGAVYLNIFHADLPEFLSSKHINADEKSRLQTLSIGLIVPTKFFELAEQNKDLYFFYPHSVYQQYGKTMDEIDFDTMYEELLANPKVRKKKSDTSAREMLTKIAITQLESGYPYIMFKTNANKQHPLKNIGTVNYSNLCTEIFQLNTQSFIADYGDKDDIGYDIQCVLGSLNIVNVMDKKRIREAVTAGMDMLTAVLDRTDIKNAPSIMKAQRDFRAVGLGAMNLHGYLAKNFIPYESEEARDFANTFFMIVNYYSILRSMEISKQRGPFKFFEKSDYASGEYFNKYIDSSFAPQTERAKKLFDGIYIPTQEDWRALAEQVKMFGLYHAYRLAIAPTQSISYIQNATSSVMPVVGHIETRTYGDSTTYYPMPFLSPQTMWFYKSAYNMDQKKVIDMVATIQQHVDQGISCILYVNYDVSTERLAHYYAYAHHKGLKSLYYTRTKNLTVEECLNCSV